MKIFFLFFLLSTFTYGQTTDFGKPPGAPGKLSDAYLKDEDQKYYKNQAFSGENATQRVDSLVKEINKVHGEMANMKKQIDELKKEVESLKKK